jgi:hypothetical protein
VNATSRGSPPGSSEGSPRQETAHHSLGKTYFTRDTEKRNWRRSLELALDALIESESGDLSLIAQNLTQAASEMLSTAVAIRRELRQ